MALDDYAASGTDIVRVEEAVKQPYRLDDYDEIEADEIGTDSFPQFGVFLDCTALDGNGDDLGPRYVECPKDMARSLVNAGVSEGDSFVLTSVTKTEDGAWSVSADRWEA